MHCGNGGDDEVGGGERGRTRPATATTATEGPNVTFCPENEKGTNPIQINHK